MIPELTLLENVSLPLMLRGVSKKAARARAAESLEFLGLCGETVDRTAQAVSGGEAQRAAIARAMVGEPAVLFADEPTGAIDSANGAVIVRLLRTAADAGQTTVLVTHDAAVAGHADRVVTLRDGQVEG
jgi:putative ABC transport system ATP-binding protein